MIGSGIFDLFQNPVPRSWQPDQWQRATCFRTNLLGTEILFSTRLEQGEVPMMLVCTQRRFMSRLQVRGIRAILFGH